MLFDNLLKRLPLPYVKYQKSGEKSSEKLGKKLGKLPETLQKLCVSTKFPHQKITWNFGILCSRDICVNLILVVSRQWPITKAKVSNLEFGFYLSVDILLENTWILLHIWK